MQLSSLYTDMLDARLSEVVYVMQWSQHCDYACTRMYKHSCVLKTVKAISTVFSGASMQ
jgi:hypothetical protein